MCCYRPRYVSLKDTSLRINYSRSCLKVSDVKEDLRSIVVMVWLKFEEVESIGRDAGFSAVSQLNVVESDVFVRRK